MSGCFSSDGHSEVKSPSLDRGSGMVLLYVLSSLPPVHDRVDDDDDGEESQFRRGTLHILLRNSGESQHNLIHTPVPRGNSNKHQERWVLGE